MDKTQAVIDRKTARNHWASSQASSSKEAKRFDEAKIFEDLFSLHSCISLYKTYAADQYSRLHKQRMHEMHSTTSLALSLLF